MTEQLESKLQSDPESRPVPVGWRILIEHLPIRETTRGGIALPDMVKQANEHLQFLGYVVAMGPLCYKHAKFEGGEPWCQVGDLVAVGDYVGQTQKIRSKTAGEHVRMRLVNDDAIMARIPSTDAVMVYA